MFVLALFLSSLPAEVAAAKDSWRIGDPQSSGNLTLYPVLTSNADTSARFTPLDEALDKRELEVGEVGDGDVSSLRVKNKGKGRVFVMTGEMFAGAKQDRISAHDVISDAAAQLQIPVYCVEQGRWHGQTHRFSAGYNTATKGVRVSATKKAPQAEVWHKVAAKSADAHVISPTGTLREVMEAPAVKRSTKSYIAAHSQLASANPDMIGMVVVIDGRVSSADVFSNRPLFLALWPKLLKSAATDAATTASRAELAVAQPSAFIEKALAGKFSVAKSPGVGTEYLLAAGDDISGTALAFEGKLVHLALFSRD